MKLTMGEVVNAYRAIRGVQGAKGLPESLSSDVSFRLGLVASRIEGEFKEYNKRMEELRDKYGEAKVKGAPKVVAPESKNYPTFVDAINKIDETVLEDVHVYTIKLSLLKDEKALGAVIQAIFPFIIDDLDEEKEPKPPKEKEGK